MKDPSSRSLAQASGVRVLTLILMVLLFAAAAVYFQACDLSFGEGAFPPAPAVPAARPETLEPLPEERISGPLLEETPPEKMVFTLEDVIFEPEHPEIPGGKKEDPKKLHYNFGIHDSTGRGTVRASNATVGVDYKLSERAVLGVEASQEIHDTGDAAAWGRSVDDETAARAKYKIVF